MSNNQEQGLRILDNALWRIAHRGGDCEYEGDASRSEPCDCATCVAKAALEAAKSWRFHGAMHERIQYQADSWPREVKMHAAWMKLLTTRDDADRLLAKAILNETELPSARDWYVATSVVQWLATNVGRTVLEAAGFHYVQDEQDRANADTFRRRLEREAEGKDKREETKP